MSTVDRVQSAVMSDMLRGSLSPGSWIRQDELAERLGVSKIPVREALQRLSVIGLVRFETNRGAMVPELSADEAEENFELRRAIEEKLLIRAIPRLSIVDLAEAEVVLRSDSASVSNNESNWEFHHAIYRAAGWSRGLAMAEILHAAVAPYVVLYTEGLGGGPDSDCEHQAILAACRDTDVEMATKLLDQHLTNAADALTAFLRSK